MWVMRWGGGRRRWQGNVESQGAGQRGTMGELG